MEKQIQLKDGTEALIRDLRQDDMQRSLEFFAALPPEERIYLRNDVTRPEVIRERIAVMKGGRIKRLVAIVDDRIVADGSVETEGFSWRGHVAELRLLVADTFRRRKLGMMMARELYWLATSKRVEDIIVKIMRPQVAARKVISRLGFKEEACLPDYVRDTQGNKHDLIIMRCKLQKMMGELEEYFTSSDWQRTR